MAAARVTLDDKEHVHVYYSTADSAAARAALNGAGDFGFDHAREGTMSMVYNSNRRALVTVFRRAMEALQESGFEIDAVDEAATGPNARIWEEDGLAMVVIYGLPTQEAFRAASGVYIAALLDAGLSTPSQFGHAEPSVEGISGHSLRGAYEPGQNAKYLADALREQRWRVEQRKA